MAIHLGPSVARRLLRPTRGLGSAPLAPGRSHGVAPSYLALLRVEFARFTPPDGSRRRPASSLWHWSSPCGGRALPATLRCGARTFLTPPRRTPPARSHPTASLTGGLYALARTAPLVPQAPGRTTTEAGPPAVARSIASLQRASATEF